METGFLNTKDKESIFSQMLCHIYMHTFIHAYVWICVFVFVLIKELCITYMLQWLSFKLGDGAFSPSISLVRL